MVDLILAFLMYVFFGNQHLVQEKVFLYWAHTYDKKYQTQQQQNYRFNIFQYNLQLITQHNLKYHHGQVTYQLQLNTFADLTQDQFTQLYLQKETKKPTITRSCQGSITDVPNPPDSVDWTSKAVTRIKDQGQCGSCWSFSATGGLQGLYSITKGRKLQFSEKQLMDCSSSYGNGGCNGGLATFAYQYVIDEGITTEDVIPYSPSLGRCTYTSTMKAFQINKCAQVPKLNQSALISATVKQPVSVGVRADQSGFRFYKSGVFDGECGYQHNHAVILFNQILAVGYGTQSGKKYWKCKNSWGEEWGDNGFIKLVRSGDGNGQCGIQTQPSVPL